jgi:hypothetical protein
MSNVSYPERNARMRAGSRNETGVVAWEVERATFGTAAMASKLLAGWEPFCVEGEIVYFRRQTVAAGP